MTSSTQEGPVAVIGLGAMGLPVALRIAETRDVRGYDVSAERVALAASGGIAAAASAVDACRDATVVLLAVRDGAQLHDVLFGEHGFAPSLSRGSVVIVTSTVGVRAVQEVASRLEADGVELVDAPMSGGPVRARNGDLLVVVGASDAALATARPVLARMATTLSVVGRRAGDGQALKTVNQLLCGVHIAAAAEALALARGMGLDPAAVLPLLGAGAAESFMLGDRGPRMVEALEGGEPEVRSRLDIFVKDLGIVQDAARAHHVSTPLAAIAEQLFRLGEAHGYGTLDDSALVRLLTS
ncbi:MAG: NAD(P)-dependent oxidoreductase [Acidobacteria bacterium]|nr:NAD(P)-dependent oxidoreductase [Acidobacteriota bacterium]